MDIATVFQFIYALVYLLPFIGFPILFFWAYKKFVKKKNEKKLLIWGIILIFIGFINYWFALFLRPQLMQKNQNTEEKSLPLTQ